MANTVHRDAFGGTLLCNRETAKMEMPVSKTPYPRPIFHVLVRAFWCDARGATAIEYALIASLIAVAIIGAVTALGGSVLGLFDEVAVGVQ